MDCIHIDLVHFSQNVPKECYLLARVLDMFVSTCHGRKGEVCLRGRQSAKGSGVMVKDSQKRSREESLVDVSSRQLQRALKQTKQALESHRRSLVGLEIALIEFEGILNLPERRPERPQVKEQGGVGAGSPDLLSITEVCQELRRGTSWVYRRIQSGEIPSVKLGDNIKVRREDLEGYLQDNSSDE